MLSRIQCQLTIPLCYKDPCLIICHSAEQMQWPFANLYIKPTCCSEVSRYFVDHCTFWLYFDCAIYYPSSQHPAILSSNEAASEIKASSALDWSLSQWRIVILFRLMFAILSACLFNCDIRWQPHCYFVVFSEPWGVITQILQQL